MNILVLGNGFDLVHGLSTSYNDFLGFCKSDKRSYTIDSSVEIEQYEHNNRKRLILGWC